MLAPASLGTQLGYQRGAGRGEEAGGPFPGKGFGEVCEREPQAESRNHLNSGPSPAEEAKLAV